VANIFRRRVEQRIGQLGITRSDLARRLGVTPAVIGQTLNEDRSPREATVHRWARALETSPEWLLGHDAGAAPVVERIEDLQLQAARLVLGCADAFTLRQVLLLFGVDTATGGEAQDSGG